MCELVDLQEDSVVLDICVGSGGFSAVAYGMIERKIRESGKSTYEKLVKYLNYLSYIRYSLEENVEEYVQKLKAKMKSKDSK